MSDSFANHSRVFHTLLFFAAALSMLSCDRTKPTSPEAKLRFESVIPKPVEAVMSGNTFAFSEASRIVIEGPDKGLENVANFLAEKMRPATGLDLAVETDEHPGKGSVFLTLSNDADLGEEGYELTIDEDRIRITANTPQGLFWGAQTLRQLLPEEVEHSSVAADVPWELATGKIRDYPVYGWRGSMIDVARHFFGVEDIKRYIDLISLYKMNMLHLHLSDDQGWRIEIQSWPNLHEVGSRTQVGGGKGGYYTRQDYAEIVDYAAKHYITIIPEIDMPGHINSALVSYKELLPGMAINPERGRPRPKAGEVYTGIEVGFSTLDYKNELTFRFVNDVLKEIAEMTPGPYLHIGGDEAAVTKKADYIAFINRFKEIVESNNKKMIGWEEIAQADIDSTITVQHWHSQPYARMAAEKGAKLIFSPAGKVYLDMQYDSTTKLGLHWAAYIEVDSSYLWDPATRVPGIDPSQIRGVEAPLWSETVVTMDDIEYMLFPRLPGVAEVGWTRSQDRNWNDYKGRLANQSKRWDALQINYYKSPKVSWAKGD